MQNIDDGTTYFHFLNEGKKYKKDEK